MFCKTTAAGAGFHRQILKYKETNMKKLGLVFICAIGLGVSCEESPYAVNPPEIQVDEKGISTVIDFIDFNVSELQSSSKGRDIDPITAAKIIERNISAFEKRTGHSIRSFDKSSLKSFDTRLSIDLHNKIVELSRSSKNELDFIERLATVKGTILNSQISHEEKSAHFNRVVLIERFVKYMGDKDRAKSVVSSGKDEEKVEADDCSGWWDCWGRCAAGIVGGAGLGALGGAAVAGGGCTVVLPIVGTVACGTVGAVAGGVFGGLAGASQSC